MKTMTSRAWLVALSLLLLALLPAPLLAKDADDAGNFVQKAIGDLFVGPPVRMDEVVLFPLLTLAKRGDIGVDPGARSPAILFAEPEIPSNRYNVQVQNSSNRPMLILGGTVLEGGLRDRLIRRDSLIAPGGAAEVRALPAAAHQDRRTEAAPFVETDSLAPMYLRRKADFGASAQTVLAFIRHFLDFRNEGDDRQSLSAISESEKLKKFCVACQRSLASFPIPVESRRVVGAIAAVRGRIQGLVLFGNNEFVKAYFGPLLKGATYAAAAIRLRASNAAIALPGLDNPEAMLADLAKDANELVDQLRRARFKKERVGEGEVGEALLIRTPDGTRGRAVGYGGELVHLALYPYEPFENAFYGSTLQVPDEETQSDPERTGITEMERRAGRGARLTDAEQRLLDRLRDRQMGGSGPARPGGITLPPRR